MEINQWSELSPEEKKTKLFLEQKKTLDLFLEKRSHQPGAVR